MTDNLEHLLVVQDYDTTITQLQHRRDALPETSGLRGVEIQLAALDAERDDATARRNVLGVDARRTSRRRSPSSPNGERGSSSGCTRRRARRPATSRP